MSLGRMRIRDGKEEWREGVVLEAGANHGKGSSTVE